MKKRTLFTFLALLLFQIPTFASIYLFVTEYNTGNLRAFDYTTGSPVTVPSSYTPIGGSSAGADGMVTGPDGRLYVNRGDGTISVRSLDGTTFSTFTTLTGVSDLLDLDRDSNYLYAARYNFNTIYRISLADGSFTTINGPIGSVRFDGVRIGPDGRLYAVDSSNGNIYAYDFSTSIWTTFLINPLAGDASQIEFGSDGRVFLSRTISNQAQIYSYTLTIPGDYSSGLNPLTQTLIGSYGSTGAATGIRIGPDGRLYANAFNAGEIWRSNVGITAMESTAFITGLSNPGSIYFTLIPEPSSFWLLAFSLGWFLFFRRKKPTVTAVAKEIC